MTKNRLNIMVIITHDTERHLSCYGRGSPSPNLDKLAERGVKFTQAFCTAPQCSHSRGSLLTELIPHRHGLIGLVHRGFCLNPELGLLPKLLSQVGYSTHLFGYQHEITWDKLSELGYQHIHCSYESFCLKVTPLVLKFLESQPSKPFFAMVGFKKTHRPFPKINTPLKQVYVPPFLTDAPEVQQDIVNLNEAVRRVDESIGQSSQP